MNKEELFNEVYQTVKYIYENLENLDFDMVEKIVDRWADKFDPDYVVGVIKECQQILTDASLGKLN